MRDATVYGAEVVRVAPGRYAIHGRLSLDEAGKLMGVSESRAHALEHQALRKFYRKLDRGRDPVVRDALIELGVRRADDGSNGGAR